MANVGTQTLAPIRQRSHSNYTLNNIELKHDNLDILMPELTSPHANVPNVVLLRRHRCMLGFSTTRDVCDWLKEMQSRPAVFFSFSFLLLKTHVCVAHWAPWREIWPCKASVKVTFSQKRHLFFSNVPILASHLALMTVLEEWLVPTRIHSHIKLCTKTMITC